MIPWRRKLYRFPYYFLKQIPLLLKGLALLFAVGVVLTSVDTPDVAYNPKVTIDAWTVKNNISPDLYGYSTSSEFTYDEKLLTAVKATGAQSMRLTDGFDPGARMLVRVKDGDFKILDADNTPYVASQEYILKAQVSGANIKIFIDDKKVLEANDAVFANGNVGLLTSYNTTAYFDDIKVESADGQTLFSDSFASKASTMWNNDNFPAWHTLGTWQAKNGHYEHLGNQDFSIKFVGLKNWADYTLTAKVKSLGAGYDLGFMGLVFRSQSVLNSYRFMWRSDAKQPVSSNRPWGVADFQGQVDFAKKANLAPIVTVNMRRDSPVKAAELVQQLNGVQSLGIKYWELGNEIYAWGDGYLENKTYAQKIKDFSQAMKAKDPNIKVGATLLMGFSDWDVEVIKTAAPYIDFVVFHYYPYWVESGISDNHMLAEGYAFGNRYKTAFSESKGALEQIKDLFKTYAPSHAERMEYVITEFNTGDYQKGVSLIYGLTTADLLGAMAERGVKIGQVHKLAAETDWQWGAFTADYRPKPTALAISLFTKYFNGDRALNTKTESAPIFSVSEKRNVPNIPNVPYLSTYASKNGDDSKLYLAVINKHGIANMKTEINIENGSVGKKARVYSLSGKSLYSNNNTTDEVKIISSEIAVSEKFTYMMPAKTAAIFEFDLEKTFAPKVEKKEETKTETKKEEKKSIGGPTGKIDADTDLVAAAGSGGNPHVKSYNKYGMASGFNKFVYSKYFRGGVSVAECNLYGNKDRQIVTGTGSGTGPQVRIYDLEGKRVASFTPFSRLFRNGIDVACGDFDGDKKDEIGVMQKNQINGEIKIYEADKKKTVLAKFKVAGKNASLAMANADKNKKAEIFVGSASGEFGRIDIYNQSGKVIRSIYPFDNYSGGVSLAAGDLNKDKKVEIVVGKLTSDSLVKIYRATSGKFLKEFYAFPGKNVGTNLGIKAATKKNRGNIVVGSASGNAPEVVVYNSNGSKKITSFLVFDAAFRGGVDVDGRK